jgi:hypothetical protein
MTEQEWLIQEAGLTQEEWNAYVALGTTNKLLAAIKKSLGLSTQALADKVAAENERLAFEKRYNDEYLPEMRKVTQDALSATARATAAEATLKQAREYGIVPPEPAGGAGGAGGAQDPPRAGGSPQPNDFDQRFNDFSRQQANAVTKLNDINAEHFKLFGTPLPNSQALVDEVQRQRTLGHKNFSLEQAWEQAYKVADKRQEIAAAARKKELDEGIAAALKVEREKNSSHPGLRTGQPSRFATYNPADATTQKPWQVPAGQRRAAMQPWRDKAVQKVRESAA